MIKENSNKFLMEIHGLTKNNLEQIKLQLDLRNKFFVLSYYAVSNAKGEYAVSSVDNFIFNHIRYCNILNKYDIDVLNNVLNKTTKLIDSLSINYSSKSISNNSINIPLSEYCYTNLYYAARLHNDSIKHGITSNKIISTYKKIILLLNEDDDNTLEKLVELNDIVIQEAMQIFEKGNYLSYASTVKQCFVYSEPTNNSIIYAGRSYKVFSKLLEATKNTDMFVYTTDKFINPIFYSKLLRFENYNGSLKYLNEKVRIPSSYEGSMIVDTLLDYKSVTVSNTSFKVFEIDDYINNNVEGNNDEKHLSSVISEAIKHSFNNNSLLKSDYKELYSGFGHRFISDKKEILFSRIISKEISEVFILIGEYIDNKTIEYILKDSTSRFIITSDINQKVITKYKENNYVVSSGDIDELYTVCKSIEFVNSSLINALKIKPKIYLSAPSFEYFRYISVFRYFGFNDVTVLTNDIANSFKELFDKMYEINISNINEEIHAIA